MNAAEVVAILGLAIWFLLTVVCQLPSGWLGGFDEFLKARDVCGVIPLWTFFAPNPGMSDHHLLYRERLVNGYCGNWREVPLANAGRWTIAVWNPNKRREKALSDCISSLFRYTVDNPESPLIKLSVPYLVILDYITSLPHLGWCTARQFMVIDSYGYGSDKAPLVLFVSDWHRVEPERVSAKIDPWCHRRFRTEH